MVRVRVRADPQAGAISFELEGEHDEIVAFNPEDFGRLNQRIIEFANAVGIGTTSAPSVKEAIRKKPPSGKQTGIDGPVLSVPADHLEKILQLEEMARIPVMWYFSSKPSMTVNEFLSAAAKKGVPLSSSWSPSAGGNFTTRLVNKDKMFVAEGKVGRTTKFRLTDLGLLKVEKTLAELKSGKTH